MPKNNATKNCTQNYTKILWNFFFKLKKKIYDVMAIKKISISLAQKKITNKIVTSLSSLTTLTNNKMWVCSNFKSCLHLCYLECWVNELLQFFQTLLQHESPKLRSRIPINVRAIDLKNLYKITVDLLPTFKDIIKHLNNNYGCACKIISLETI